MPLTLEMLLCPSGASVSPAEGTSAQSIPGGLLRSPQLALCPTTKKARRGSSGDPASITATPVPSQCSVPPKPRHRHAPTLNVCFRLMLSEGCTAATRKLRRGMLPRILSSFSSGGQMRGLHTRRGWKPSKDPGAAVGTRSHRSFPWADRPPVGNRCLPVAPRQLFPRSTACSIIHARPRLLRCQG